MPKQPERFWMVIRHDAAQAPVVRHTSEHAAYCEAERLAKKEGKLFHVLETIKYVQPQETPVVWSSNYTFNPPLV